MKNILTLLLFVFSLSFYSQSKQEIDLIIQESKSIYENDDLKSFELAKESLNKSLNIDYNKGIADSYYIMSCYYLRNNSQEECIKFSYKALESYKKIDDKIGVSDSYLGLGMAYDKFNISDNVIEYYEKARDEIFELGNTKELANIYTSISFEYNSLGNQELALSYIDSSISITKAIKDSNVTAHSLNAKGFILRSSGNLVLSKKYYLEALDIFKSMGQKRNQIAPLINIGSIMMEQSEFNESKKYFIEANEYSIDIDDKYFISMTSRKLSSVYYKLKDYKNAYEYFKLYKTYNDSLVDTENTKKLVEIKMQNEFNDELSKISLEQEKKDLIINEELKRSEIIRNSLIGGALLLLIVVIVSLRAFNIKKKANHEIAEKNKEITDSINYAQMLQAAILSPSKKTDDELKDLFVLFQPKDIVSGDFYWVEKNQIDNSVMFAAIDCTGHGVPGAMLSIVGHNALENIIHTKHVNKPSQILNELNSEVYSKLKSNGSREMGDGMDVSLCRFDRGNKTLEFSGANNPVYIVRGEDVIVQRGTKIAIGQEPDSDFAHNEILLQEGDCVYVFSDGYADQFGGPNDKKLGSKEFKNILISIKDYDMDAQRNILLETIKEWMGGSEQIDDICVIGMRV